LFVDLSNKASVDDIDSWVKEIKEASGACPILVIGNKADNKKVGDADKVAKSNGCQYIEVSAKTGQNVIEMIEQVVSEFR
jgi:50S ribosomal subunit-associated GTPase HflX